MSSQTPAAQRTAATPTTADVWRAIEKSSNAVMAHVTPRGEPRTSCVVYRALDRAIYVAVAQDSWKARHVASDGRVSMTVLVHRGGVLALMVPIPPASITFHGTAQVLAADDPQVAPMLASLGPLIPPDSAPSSALIRVRPEGEFLCYGIGVPLMTMRDPHAARSRVPVEPTA